MWPYSVNSPGEAARGMTSKGGHATRALGRGDADPAVTRTATAMTSTIVGFMTPPLARGRNGAEPDEDPARRVADCLPAAADEAADRPARERVRAGADQPERHPAEAEHGDLRPDGSVAVDELRQEGEEGQGRVRIQHVDDDSPGEDAAAAARGAGFELGGLVALEPFPDPPVDDVRGADVLDRAERHRR